jgi:hypothetical protein
MTVPVVREDSAVPANIREPVPQILLAFLCIGLFIDETHDSNGNAAVVESQKKCVRIVLQFSVAFGVEIGVFFPQERRSPVGIGIEEPEWEFDKCFQVTPGIDYLGCDCHQELTLR